MGNALLLCNCLATALYVICVKLALARGYPPSTITAWSYACGATMMAGLATLTLTLALTLALTLTATLSLPLPLARPGWRAAPAATAP